MKRRVVVFSVLLVSCALAQESRPVLRGVWSATAGASAFRGRWWAEINEPDAASGSWTLLDDSNRIILEGVWSARRLNAPAKVAAHWHGTWTARAGAGRTFSGTWQADLTDFSGKTLEDMLKHTLDQQVSGSWRSGRAQGNWWLQGSK